MKTVSWHSKVQWIQKIGVRTDRGRKRWAAHNISWWADEKKRKSFWSMSLQDDHEADSCTKQCSPLIGNVYYWACSPSAPYPRHQSRKGHRNWLPFEQWGIRGNTLPRCVISALSTKHTSQVRWTKNFRDKKNWSQPTTQDKKLHSWRNHALKSTIWQRIQFKNLYCITIDRLINF